MHDFANQPCVVLWREDAWKRADKASHIATVGLFSLRNKHFFDKIISVISLWTMRERLLLHAWQSPWTETHGRYANWGQTRKCHIKGQEARFLNPP